jgi:hypothetical protein
MDYSVVDEANGSRDDASNLLQINAVRLRWPAVNKAKRLNNLKGLKQNHER